MRDAFNWKSMTDPPCAKVQCAAWAEPESSSSRESVIGRRLSGAGASPSCGGIVSEEVVVGTPVPLRPHPLSNVGVQDDGDDDHRLQRPIHDEAATPTVATAVTASARCSNQNPVITSAGSSGTTIEPQTTTATV